jgi:8-oxo-dGTP diphosphatase
LEYGSILYFEGSDFVVVDERCSSSIAGALFDYRSVEMTEKKPIIRVVAAAIERSNQYLITQRRATAVLPLLWEFPGGKVEPGESDPAALIREIKSRLDVTVEVGLLLSAVRKEYTNYTVDLHLYSCSIVEGEPRAAAVNTFRWATVQEFDSLQFTPADQESMDRLLGVTKVIV